MASLVKAYKYNERLGRPEDAEIRRIPLENGASYDFSEFNGKLMQVFTSLIQDKFTIYWKDDEDDFVTVSSDEEMQQMLNNMADDDQVIRVHIVQDGSHDTDYQPGAQCQARGQWRQRYFHRMMMPGQDPGHTWENADIQKRLAKRAEIKALKHQLKQESKSENVDACLWKERKQQWHKQRAEKWAEKRAQMMAEEKAATDNAGVSWVHHKFQNGPKKGSRFQDFKNMMEDSQPEGHNGETGHWRPRKAMKWAMIKAFQDMMATSGQESDHPKTWKEEEHDMPLKYHEKLAKIKLLRNQKNQTNDAKSRDFNRCEKRAARWARIKQQLIDGEEPELLHGEGNGMRWAKIKAFKEQMRKDKNEQDMDQAPEPKVKQCPEDQTEKMKTPGSSLTPTSSKEAEELQQKVKQWRQMKREFKAKQSHPDAGCEDLHPSKAQIWAQMKALRQNLRENSPNDGGISNWPGRNRAHMWAQAQATKAYLDEEYGSGVSQEWPAGRFDFKGKNGNKRAKVQALRQSLMKGRQNSRLGDHNPWLAHRAEMGEDNIMHKWSRIRALKDQLNGPSGNSLTHPMAKWEKKNFQPMKWARIQAMKNRMPNGEAVTIDSPWQRRQFHSGMKSARLAAIRRQIMLEQANVDMTESFSKEEMARECHPNNQSRGNTSPTYWKSLHKTDCPSGFKNKCGKGSKFGAKMSSVMHRLGEMDIANGGKAPVQTEEMA